jgi:hypothetical protein
MSTDYDSDIDIDVPVIPTKKQRLEKGNSVKENANQDPTIIISQPAKDIGDSGSHSNSRNALSDRRQDSELITQPVSTGSDRDVETQSAAEVTDRRTVIQKPKRAATQLKEVPKARVSFASARTTSTTSTVTPKPFIPLDEASIRRGFQEGGASTKKEDLKKGTYMLVIYKSKTIQLIIFGAGIQLNLLSQRRFGSFPSLKFPSRNLCPTRHK